MDWNVTAKDFRFKIGDLVRHKTTAFQTYVVLSRSLHQGELSVSRQYLVESLTPQGPTTQMFTECSLEPSNVPTMSVGACLEQLEHALTRDKSDGDEVISLLDRIRELVCD